MTKLLELFIQKDKQTEIYCMFLEIAMTLKFKNKIMMQPKRICKMD